MKLTCATVVAVLAAVALAGCEPTTRPEPTLVPSVPVPTESLFGPGCAAYLKDHPSGRGSASDLATKSLAEALADQPQLRQFARAMTGKLNERVDLTDELDGGEFSVFAPTDEAFGKLPSGTLHTLANEESVDALTDLLMFHLIVGQRMPAAIFGDQETRGGAKLTVTGDGERIRVGGQANVICGGIRTANATLYLIDTVLMPPSPSPSPSAPDTDASPSDGPPGDAENQPSGERDETRPGTSVGATADRPAAAATAAAPDDQ